MAGDWIKMRVGLQYGDPHVVRIMSLLHADSLRTDCVRNADRLATVGALHAVWCVFDQYSTDGKVTYTPAEMDAFLGWTGFTQAMIDVGWIEFDGANTLIMHNPEAHNGKSAKRRASEAMRMQSVRNCANGSANPRVPREDKREERGAATNGTPEGLNELQYAARLMEEIKMPSTPQNLRQVAAGIKSEKSRGGLAKAYEFVLSQAQEEIRVKGNVTGFWFQDATWRKKKTPENNGILSVNGADKRREAMKRLGGK